VEYDRRVSADVCFVVGARPNFMKAAPVLRAVRSLDPEVTTLLVHTGQHYDKEMSDVFLDELELPRPDVHLGIGSGTHAEQTAAVLLGVERIVLERRPAMVVVPGDVNSTLGAALAAVKQRVPVAHLEAGLRSFDPEMPEEHNRRLTDHVSDLLLTHSESAVENLRAEGITRGVHLVGNTMIDSLHAHLEAARSAQPWRALGHEARGYALVTLHRPALVDDDGQLAAVVAGLIALRASLPVVLPAHPRTRSRLQALGLDVAVERAGITITDPLGYLAFLGLESEARLVVTDSGGVQEETSALGVPCFTLRDSTERPVTVELGTNVVLGARPERIGEIPDLVGAQERREVAIPLWDGRAGERAAKVILASLRAGT
jgi:UDP-N-acetylglucosamine 2-epimerase (non-hydrolysing)